MLVQEKNKKLCMMSSIEFPILQIPTVAKSHAVIGVYWCVVFWCMYA